MSLLSARMGDTSKPPTVGQAILALFWTHREWFKSTLAATGSFLLFALNYWGFKVSFAAALASTLAALLLYVICRFVVLFRKRATEAKPDPQYRYWTHAEGAAWTLERLICEGERHEKEVSLLIRMEEEAAKHPKPSSMPPPRPGTISAAALHIEDEYESLFSPKAVRKSIVEWVESCEQHVERWFGAEARRALGTHFVPTNFPGMLTPIEEMTRRLESLKSGLVFDPP